MKENERLHAVGLLLEPLPPGQHAGLLQHQAAVPRPRRRAAGASVVALELHGDLDQRDRDQVLVQFANRSCSVLVATDVAARGLDIAQLEAVINVDITPDAGGAHASRRPHRPRATKRAGRFSLASLDEMGRIGRIDADAGQRGRVA